MYALCTHIQHQCSTAHFFIHSPSLHTPCALTLDNPIPLPYLLSYSPDFSTYSSTSEHVCQQDSMCMYTCELGSLATPQKNAASTPPTFVCRPTAEHSSVCSPSRAPLIRMRTPIQIQIPPLDSPVCVRKLVRACMCVCVRHTHAAWQISAG